MESYPEKGTWRGTGFLPVESLTRQDPREEILALPHHCHCETPASGRYRGPLRAQPPAA